MIDTSPEAVERVAAKLEASATDYVPDMEVIGEAAALLRALAPDAARYRYLRGVDTDGTPPDFQRGPLYAGNVNEELDAAVDRAIAATLQTETGGKR